MKVLLCLLALPCLALANPPGIRSAPQTQTQTVRTLPPKTTVREIEVPQPPKTVTDYVPVERQVPQPPRKFQEITTTYYRELVTEVEVEAEAYVVPRTYTMPATMYTMPVAAATTTAAPTIYIVPVDGLDSRSRTRRDAEVVQFQRHVLGGTTTRYGNGVEVRRGPFGRVRSVDGFGRSAETYR